MTVLYKHTCIYNDITHHTFSWVGKEIQLSLIVAVDDKKKKRVEDVEISPVTAKHLPSLDGSDNRNLQLPVFFSFFVTNMAVVWKRKLGCL